MVNASAFFSYYFYSTPSTSSIVSTSTAATISTLCFTSAIVWLLVPPSFDFYFLPIFTPTPTSSSTLLSLQLPLLYSFHFYLAHHFHFHYYYFSTTARTSISTLAFTSTSFPFRVLGRRSKQFSHVQTTIAATSFPFWCSNDHHCNDNLSSRHQSSSSSKQSPTSSTKCPLCRCYSNARVPYLFTSQCRCADVIQVPTQTCSAGRHCTPTEPRIPLYVPVSMC